MLPKELKNDDYKFPSFIIDEKGNTICVISNTVNDPKIKEEIIYRYNNYSGILTALIVMSILFVISTYLLLYIKF